MLRTLGTSLQHTIIMRTLGTSHLRACYCNGRHGYVYHTIATGIGGLQDGTNNIRPRKGCTIVEQDFSVTYRNKAEV